MGNYRCSAKSVSAFIQQLAVGYVTHGYWFYVTGRVPEGKDPKAVDEKLIKKYGLNISRTARSRRKQAGIASVQYLRHNRFFVLIATKGAHPFFEEEPFKDIRHHRLKYGGYSVSYKAGHACVRIEREQYKCLKSYFEDLATSRHRETLDKAFSELPFSAYAPVRRQLLDMVSAVNKKRKEAGYEPLSWSCLRLTRRNVRVFEEGEA